MANAPARAAPARPARSPDAEGGQHPVERSGEAVVDGQARHEHRVGHLGGQAQVDVGKRRVHRHPHTWELLTPLRGRFLVLTYDESGKVTDRLWLGGDTRLLEIPANTWHSVLSLDEGGVIFEVKHGAYQPVTEEDYLPGSAPEGDERVKATLEWYANAEIGDVFAV